jgi:hypothetical protein
VKVDVAGPRTTPFTIDVKYARYERGHRQAWGYVAFPESIKVGGAEVKHLRVEISDWSKEHNVYVSRLVSGYERLPDSGSALVAKAVNVEIQKAGGWTALFEKLLRENETGTYGGLKAAQDARDYAQKILDYSTEVLRLTEDFAAGMFDIVNVVERFEVDRSRVWQLNSPSYHTKAVEQEKPVAAVHLDGEQIGWLTGTGQVLPMRQPRF